MFGHPQKSIVRLGFLALFVIKSSFRNLVNIRLQLDEFDRVVTDIPGVRTLRPQYIFDTSANRYIAT